MRFHSSTYHLTRGHHRVTQSVPGLFLQDPLGFEPWGSSGNLCRHKVPRQWVHGENTQCPISCSTSPLHQRLKGLHKSSTSVAVQGHKSILP